jgi:tetratricopeptide (TPR) repeat protein
LGEERDDDSLRLAGIAEKAIFYSVSRIDPEASKMHSEAALELARRLGDRSTEARSLWSLLLLNSWSAKDEALAYGEEGLLIARELVEDPTVTNEDLEILALLLLDLSVPLVALGRVDESISKTLEAKDLFERIGNLPMVTTAAQRLGMAYKAVGRFQESEKFYQQATEIDISIGNSGGLIGISLGLMDVYPQTGNIQRFFDMLEQLKPVLGVGRQVPEEIAKFYPLVIYFYMGAFDRALAMADDVIEFNRKRMLVWSDSFLVALIRIYLGVNDNEMAKKLLARIGTDLDEENYLSPMSSQLPQVKAELALSDNDWQGALRIAEDYIEKANEKGMLSFLPEKLMLKSEILNTAGEEEAAYSALREAYTLSDDQNTRMFLWEICARLAAMEVEIGNLAEAERYYEQARSAVDFITAHAGQDDLRDAFLSKPLVQTVMSKTTELE